MIRRAAYAFAWLVVLATPVASSRVLATDIPDLRCHGCNLVLLDLDLLRSDFVGLLTGDASLTPNINRFFSQSILFTDVMSSSGLTALSNTSTLTARDGHLIDALLQRTLVQLPNGTPWPTPSIPARHLKMFETMPTIAERLRAQGYHTINVNHGGYAGRQMLLDRGFESYWGLGEDITQDSLPADAIRRTIAVIEGQRRQAPPFFLLMRSEDLRGFPFRYPEGRQRFESPWISYRSIGKAYQQVWYRYLDDGAMKEGFPNFMSWARGDEREALYRNLAKRLYAQQLGYIDEELGRLFQALEDSESLKHTIVVLYSNHGDGLYDNRMPNHGHSYQSCVSVPILIRHPHVKQPIRVDQPVRLIGLVPTLYDMLGISSPADLDATSFEPEIRGERRPDELFFGVDLETQYVRQGSMKLIVWADRAKELYDLSRDPHELNNIADQYPDLVQALDSALTLHALEALSRALKIYKSAHVREAQH